MASGGGAKQKHPRNNPDDDVEKDNRRPSGSDDDDNFDDAADGAAQMPSDWQTAFGVLSMQMQQQSNILMAALGLDQGGQP